MNDEQRENLKAANKRRGNCPKCGGSKYSLDTRDGGEVGGLPGIKYKVCPNCGYAQAVTHRQRKFKL
jgi:ribosomal protein S27AE